MGLDMYLTAQISFWSFYAGDTIHNQKTREMQTKIRNIINSKLPGNLTGAQLRIGYWRKANAIHNWFVENCQEGVDECQEAWVQDHSIIQLRDLCIDLLKERDPKKAEEKLPTKSGFFFGPTEYNDYYWESLKSTEKICRDALKVSREKFPEGTTVSLYYSSSW